MLELFNQIARRIEAGEAVAVCTLVRTRGSTPQKAGAIMVVLRDGHTLGTIGGGCVEAEVRLRALHLLGERSGRLLSFQLDHDLGWDDGLICGGTMDVAVEVIDSPQRAGSLLQVRDNLAAGRVGTMTIDVPDEQGRMVRFKREYEPAPDLLIAGAGHVGAALAAIAGGMDFRVTVFDDRADLATPERFPTAMRIVGQIDSELSKFPIRSDTSIVIVTRGHRHDGLVLSAVIRSPASYIGVIGSKRKILAIFEDLGRQGIPRALLARVRAPIGLDIGAVTPAEIAVSIAAELVAHRRGADHLPASPMRLTAGQIERLGS